MIRGTCTIEGCDRPPVGRGWCRLHYSRWDRHGDALWSPPTRAADTISIGDRFGRLTVVEATWQPASNGKRNRAFRCRCSCGQERVILASVLRSGRRVSCGCTRGERMVHIGRSRRTHGHNARNSATYRSWMTMIQRCENPNHDAYHRYGGRGITICERWRHSFETFMADMGERPEGLTLDRIDNERGYEPGNCRWATRLEQSRNRRNVNTPT